MKKYNVAVVGATGNVGTEMLKILLERKFPIKQLYAIASERSKGETIELIDNMIYNVESLDEFDFSNIDIVLMSAGSEVSKKYAEKIAKKGAVIIDNSSFFRDDPYVPLIIPEINEEKLKDYKNKNIIANPNCSTIQMLMVLSPLHKLYKIKRVIVSTYQSVSGAGKRAADELFQQIKDLYNGKSIDQNKNLFPKQIAFNVIPYIDNIMDNGFTKEEWKMQFETQKILDKNIKVNATCVRVPVFLSHSLSINVEFEQEISIKEVISVLENTDGVEFIDVSSKEDYLTPLDVAGSDQVFVSRIRIDDTKENSLNLWVVADNIRKGAALNAVQIAESLDEIWQ